MDFKGTRPMLGTPGGDFGEFLLAFNCFLDVKQETRVEYDLVRKTLEDFISKHCPPNRPFYKHTDAARLLQLNKSMKTWYFPAERPNNWESWLNNLIDPEFHGCGHLRSMLTDPKSYNLQPQLVEHLVKSFYDLYWNPDYKGRLRLDILPSPDGLTEAGVVIHDTEQCNGFTPLVGKSGLYSVHLHAQNIFRSQVTAPFFVSRLENSSFGLDEFTSLMKDRVFLYWKTTGGFLNLPNLPFIEIKDDGFILNK